MSTIDIDAAKKFIMNNARPLELSVYNLFFEGGSKESFLIELQSYQNPDGGFGKALEADNWNPASNPIATNDALIFLYRTGTLDPSLGMVKDIVRYLSSHDSFDEEKRRWLFAIDSNKDYPHAIWWEKKEDGILNFNPTVSLAAFMACYGDNKEYYSSIVREAFAALSGLKTIGDEVICYMLALELLRDNRITDVIDLEGAYCEIVLKLKETICPDISKYGKEYVTEPSFIFYGAFDRYMTDDIRSIASAEKEILGDIQLEDGGFDISWQWYTDYKEFEEARAWWRPRVTLNKLLFATRW